MCIAFDKTCRMCPAHFDFAFHLFLHLRVSADVFIVKMCKWKWDVTFLHFGDGMLLFFRSLSVIFLTVWILKLFSIVMMISREIIFF